MGTIQDLADVCPENHDFAKVLWGLERLCENGSFLYWPESRQRQSDLFARLLESESFPENESLIQRFSGQPYVVGGDEHHLIYLPDSPERIFKITHSDSFGCVSRFFCEDADLNGKHFIPGVNTNPVFYLTRWMILNSLTEYRTKFEGILPPQGNLMVPRLCVSQLILAKEYRNPDADLIRKAFLGHGFKRIAQDAFINSVGIVLSDAAPRNVGIVGGNPIPFDALAEFAAPAVLDWLRAKVPSMAPLF